LAKNKFFSGLGEVRNRFTLLPGGKGINHRAGGDFQQARFAVSSGTVFPASSASVSSAGMGSKPEINQVVELWVNLENHISPLTAVASVGSTFGYKFFA
jgi:hypothetical protein